MARKIPEGDVMARLIKEFCLECGKEHTVGYEIAGEIVYYKKFHEVEKK
jgi:hypothetical protein